MGAVLASYFEDVPFMSDEALEACGCPLKYDLKTYEMMVERLSQKAETLGSGWTAERVGRALWACAALGGVASETNVDAACAATKRPAAPDVILKKPARRRMN